MRWKIKFKDNPVYKLSGNEICVGCGFLGAKNAPGIQNNLFLNGKSTPEKRIRRIVKMMEQKGLLYCGLDGVVEMVNPLYRMLETIGFADMAVCMKQWEQYKKSTTLCFYQKAGTTVAVKEVQNQHYEIYDCNFPEELLFMTEKLAADNGNMLDGQLPVNAYNAAGKAAEQFDYNTAKIIIKDNIQKGADAEYETFLEMINGKTIFLSVCIGKKRAGRTGKNYQAVAAFQKDRHFFVTLENQDTLCIKSREQGNSFAIWFRNIISSLQNTDSAEIGEKKCQI